MSVQVSHFHPSYWKSFFLIIWNKAASVFSNVYHKTQYFKNTKPNDASFPYNGGGGGGEDDYCIATAAGLN